MSSVAPGVASTTSRASRSTSASFSASAAVTKSRDQHLHPRAIDRRLELIRMDEPLVALGRLRRQLRGRQPIDEARRQPNRIDHPSLRVARMGVEAVEGQASSHRPRSSRTRARRARRRRACRRRPRRTAATSKRSAPRPISSSGVNAMRIGSVRDLRVPHQIIGRGHDLGDAGLVVRAEQGQAGRRHDVVAELRGELGISRSPGAPPMDRPAAPGRGRRRLVHERPHVGRRHFRRGVDVRDEPDHRHLVADRRRHVAIR